MPDIDIHIHSRTHFLITQANIVAACLHFGAGYLDVLASLIIIVFAACMLMVTLQVPEKFSELALSRFVASLPLQTRSCHVPFSLQWSTWK